MKLIKLWALTALTMVAFGAVGVAIASGEGDGSPAILCLERECTKKLETDTLKLETGAKWTIEDLSGDLDTATGAEMIIKGCEAIAGTEEKDTRSCKDQKLILTGVEHAAEKCNTEGDAAGTVKMLMDLVLAAELNAAGTALEPLLLMKVLNAKLEPGVLYKCGVVKITFKGTIACLVVNGLTNIAAGGNFELLCKLNKQTHDPETGKCELLCEELEKAPAEDNESGAFVDAWMNFHLVGHPSEDIFMDD
jgi:hypothetical protein